jgi:hypothetical protein
MTSEELCIFADNTKRVIELVITGYTSAKETEITNLKKHMKSLGVVKSRTQLELNVNQTRTKKLEKNKQYVHIEICRNKAGNSNCS